MSQIISTQSIINEAKDTVKAGKFIPISPHLTIVKLHQTALSMVKDKFPDILIDNLAVSGNKNAPEFNGVGQYMIFTTNAKDDQVAEKKRHFDALKLYIEFFAGEDASKNFKEEYLEEWKQDAEQQQGKQENKPVEKTPKSPSDDEEGTTSESLVLGFNIADLLLEADTPPATPAEPAKPASTEAEPSKSTATTSTPAEGDKKPEEKGAEENKPQKSGYSVTYDIKIPDEKGPLISDQTKIKLNGLFGGVLADLRSINITTRYGKTINVGKIFDPDAWKKLARTPDIDANTIADDISHVLKKDYPNIKAWSPGVYRTSETLSMLKKPENIKQVSPQDLNKISQTKYNITLQVEHDNPIYDKIDADFVAEEFTKAMGSNDYKFYNGNKVKGKDLVVIKNIDTGLKIKQKHEVSGVGVQGGSSKEKTSNDKDTNKKEPAKTTSNKKEVKESFLFEEYYDGEFEDLIIEKKHLGTNDPQFLELKKILSNPETVKKIRSQENEIWKKAYTNVENKGRLFTWADKESNTKEYSSSGAKKFHDYIFNSEITDDFTGEGLNRATRGKNFKNDIVYRFVAALKKIGYKPPEPTPKDTNHKVYVQFQVKIPNSDKIEKIGDAIEINSPEEVDNLEIPTEEKVKEVSKIDNREFQGFDLNKQEIKELYSKILNDVEKKPAEEGTESDSDGKEKSAEGSTEPTDSGKESSETSSTSLSAEPPKTTSESLVLGFNIADLLLEADTPPATPAEPAKPASTATTAIPDEGDKKPEESDSEKNNKVVNSKGYSTIYVTGTYKVDDTKKQPTGHENDVENNSDVYILCRKNIVFKNRDTADLNYKTKRKLQ